MPELALSGLKVIDLTHYIAGPFCTKLLADCGAEVVKVERPGTGDPARRLPPLVADVGDPEGSAVFLYLNTNKKSVTVNLKTDLGKEILEELLREADVLVESFRPGVLESLGFSYDEVARIKQHITYVSISNFGHTGPLRDRRASELTLSAEGGCLYITGPLERPVKLGGQQAQLLGGINAFLSVLASLYLKMTDGRGAHLDLSIVEAVACSVQVAFAPYINLGLIQSREFFRFLVGYPVNIYPCKDGYLVLMPGFGGMQMLTILMERPELTEHPLFSNRWARQERADELDSEFLLPWLADKNRDELVAAAQELRMPWSPVQTIAELLEDSQLEARGYFRRVMHSSVGEAAYPGLPFRSSVESWSFGRAPLLGQHNSEVYGKLGISENDMALLRESGVI